jgi:hypothetical protein
MQRAADQRVPESAAHAVSLETTSFVHVYNKNFLARYWNHSDRNRRANSFPTADNMLNRALIVRPDIRFFGILQIPVLQPNSKNMTKHRTTAIAISKPAHSNPIAWERYT